MYVFSDSLNGEKKEGIGKTTCMDFYTLCFYVVLSGFSFATKKTLDKKQL
jgi:hypothetical protein